MTKPCNEAATVSLGTVLMYVQIKGRAKTTVRKRLQTLLSGWRDASCAESRICSEATVLSLFVAHFRPDDVHNIGLTHTLTACLANKPAEPDLEPQSSKLQALERYLVAKVALHVDCQ